MKAKLILSLMLMSSVSFTAWAFSKAPSTDEGGAAMHHAMKAMDGMSGVELTGNPDVDFLAGMIPHHEGAISMSQQLLTKLTDSTLQQLANSIIKSQDSEISFMKTWLAANPASAKDKANIANSESMMSESMKFMNLMHSAPMTGDANKDFVLGMVPHHQAAVKMAEVILPYLKNPQVIQFAKDVIKVQNEEIQQMQDWIKKS